MKTSAWIAALFLCVAPAGAQTYAERLGWPEGARVLLINSDDAGMSHASNQGIIASVESGITTSVSVMAPCPWVPEYLDYYKQNPGTCVGAHLVLCSEWEFYRFSPVAGAAQVPSLADQQGCFHRNNALLLEHAKPEEVDIEIRAQVKRLQQMGFTLSHINTHMGSLQTRPEFLESYVALAIELQVPLRIVGDTVPDGYSSRERIEVFKPFTERVWNAGLPVLDDIHTQSYSWKTEDKFELYADAIRNLKPGITEFVVHPTKPDPAIDVATKNRILLYGDYYALKDPRLLEVIEEEGVILTSWTELMERRRAVSAAE